MGLIYQKKFCIVWHFDRSACYQVRYGNWMHLLNTGAGGECELVGTTEPIYDGLVLARTASIVIPRFAGDRAIDIRRLASFKKRYNFEIVLDYDDLLWSMGNIEPIPEYNPYRLNTHHVNAAIRDILPYVDRITFSTVLLAQLFRQEFASHDKPAPQLPALEVLPNFGFTSLAWDEKRPKRKKPLLMYTGSAAHYSADHPGDFAGPWVKGLELVADKFDIVGFGTERGPLPSSTRLIEHVPASLWLPTLSRLAPDIIIAPLKCNMFNACKSPIKAIESALVGAAFVGSAMPRGPYNPYLDPNYMVLEGDTPQHAADVLMALADPGIRQANAEFTAAQVINNGLIAESKPAIDHFLKCTYGKYVNL